ncbi:MAG TPA: translation initiation factor IF-2 [Oscillospiraceae bacterium]|nr:translation initiation factor IF-2 [Oscillospiraceae bacterium]HXK77147.1 translation initiation factor IF-2 [Oscillospiraceae bacterium]
MLVKYKVSDVAKDFRVTPKEIIDVLAARSPMPRKNQTPLTEEELDLVFEHYTKQHEVSSFNDYFAMASEPKPAPKPKTQAPAAPKEPEPAEQKAQEPVARPEAKPVRKAEPEAKTEKPTESAPKAEQTQRPEAAQRPAPKPEFQRAEPAQRPARPEQPQGQTQQGGQNRFGDRPQYQRNDRYGDRPQQGQAQGQTQQGGQNRFGDRPQYQRNDHYGDRPQQGQAQGQTQQGGQNRFGDRPQYPRTGTFGGDKAGGYGKDSSRPASTAKKEPKKPVERKPRPANLPPAEHLASGVAHVDMSAVSVDLDKYNEKYEQIAPAAATVKDNFQNKQKLTQRSTQRGRPQQSRREQEQLKLRKLEMERQRRQKLEITLPDEITVGDLALKLKIQATEIIKRLMQNGVMASITDTIDYDTAAMVAIDIGAKVEHEVVVTIEDRLIDDSKDEADNLQSRDPVVCVMGHVDHGKTSILDRIRNTNVTATEAGGITQHIGASRVETPDGRWITFLDTPGHEAFTAMRARGALCTDIAILVVAADDGIMPQTVEAINHAKAADISIIVAINKIDKPGANVDRVMQGLTEYGLVPEAWGGDVVCVPVSAKTGENIPNLLEMITLVADVKELKANPDRLAKGTVIESRLDKGRGPLATVLVQNGTLHVGDVVIAGTSVGKIRIMTDDKGNRVEEAGPAIPVEITGLDSTPTGGDIFNAVTDEKLARELVEQRVFEEKQEQFKAYQKVTLDNLFNQIAEGEMKELPIIVKADVQGSVEAVKQSLEKLSNDEIRVRVIHGGVGAVNESDVMLAQASNAIIVGFNVRPDPTARDNAEREGVEIRLYRIIYDAIEEIQSALNGMLSPKFRDVDLGRAEVRQVYKISNVGTVAGCYVLEGKITRGASIRVVRDGIIVADDKLAGLKRFKDDVKEVASGYECGITLTKFNDIKEGDVFEAYTTEQYRDNAADSSAKGGK